jgi:hypothetical protein
MGCRHLRLAPDPNCAGGTIGTIGAMGPTPAWLDPMLPMVPMQVGLATHWFATTSIRVVSSVSRLAHIRDVKRCLWRVRLPGQSRRMANDAEKSAARAET